MAGGAVVVDTHAAKRAGQYKGQHVHFYIILVGCIAACGGLLFGYDIGVSGGVSSMAAFQQKFFPDVYAKAQAAKEDPSTSPYCTFDDQLLQLFTSSLYLAGMVISVPAAWMSKRLGRKLTMLIASLWFLLGSGLCGGAVDTAMLIVGRICLGFGIGTGNSVVPVYLSEAAPARFRGAMVMLFQLAVTIGIFVASLINYGVNEGGSDNGWRISLSLAAVPGAILFVASLILPDTPNSLVARGHPEQGKRVLAKLRGISEADVTVEFEDIVEASSEAERVSNAAGWKALFAPRNRPASISTMLIAALQQLTGINAIMFYLPVIYSTLGSAHSAALLSAVVTNAVNLVCTFVAIAVVDRFGRRGLFLEGGIQMVITTVIMCIIIATQFSGGEKLSTSAAGGLLAVVCLYVAGFSWSWGPLGWLVPSEIQALEVRAQGMSLAVITNFLFTFFIGQAFLSMMCGMKWGVYLFFAGWIVIMTLFIFFCLPETKGVPVEEVRLAFARHRFWKGTMGAEGEELLAASDKRDQAIGGDVVEAGL